MQKSMSAKGDICQAQIINTNYVHETERYMKPNQ